MNSDSGSNDSVPAPVRSDNTIKRALGALQERTGDTDSEAEEDGTTDEDEYSPVGDAEH
jgi:hypothetical protein